jgi:tetratricopeptide (TPR) repeat protein
MKRAGAEAWPTLSLQKIFYYRGNLLFWYNDVDGAVEQLRKATSKDGGLDQHTALMAWLRLGQANDMKGRRSEALDAYKRAIAVAPQSDIAKESRQYLSSPYKRS